MAVRCAALAFVLGYTQNDNLLLAPICGATLAIAKACGQVIQVTHASHIRQPEA